MKEFVNSYEDYGIRINGKTPNSDGEVKVLCPQCSHLRKPANQKIPVLGVKVKEGVWGCNHCGWAGHLITTDYSKQKPKKQYVFPKREDFGNFTENLINFFKKRAISAETLAENKIGFTTISIRQNKNPDPSLVGKYMDKNCVVYNYYRDGQLVHVKYRDNYKNFSASKDTELIFYGLDHIYGCKECVIVEGENDKLAYYEAGIKNCVSVPNGARLSQKEKEHFDKTGQLIQENHQNLEYLDNCWEHFEDKETIYIATDDDAPGIKLREELARRFGYDKCKIIKFKELGGKDANEVLIAKGKEALRDTLSNATPYPIKEITPLHEVRMTMMEKFNTGKVKGKSTGWEDLDPHFRWRFGEPTLLNGYYGNGKTSFLYNLMLGSSALYGYKWGAYMPENYPVDECYDSMCEVIAGKSSDIEKMGRMNAEEYIRSMKFVEEHVTLVNNTKRYTPHELLDICDMMIKRFGIVGFVMDPWKSLKHNMSQKSIDLYLEDILGDIIDFSLKRNIIMLIATHPPTPLRDKNKEYAAPSGFEVKGGEVWASMIYNMLCVHMPSQSYLDTTSEIHVQKIKNQKLVGIRTDRNNPVLLTFDRKSGRYIDSKGTSPFDKMNSQTELSFTDESF